MLERRLMLLALSEIAGEAAFDVVFMLSVSRIASNGRVGVVRDTGAPMAALALARFVLACTSASFSASVFVKKGHLRRSLPWLQEQRKKKTKNRPER